MGWLAVSAQTGLIFGLVMALLVLLGILALLADHVIRLHYRAGEEQTEKHAACIAHIADVTSSRFTAVALRQMAERFDSPSEMGALADLRRVYKVGQKKSVPAMWMLAQAERLEKES